MIHTIKLKEQFVEPILEGKKTFEVRNNDRAYQVGDTIKFIPVSLTDTAIGKDNLIIHDTPLGRDYIKKDHIVDISKIDEIMRKEYIITYVLSGWGIDKDIVVFSFKDKMNKKRKEGN